LPLPVPDSDAVDQRNVLGRGIADAIGAVMCNICKCFYHVRTVRHSYCLAAHTAISKLHGLTPEALVALRHGKASGNLKLNALAAFTRILVNGKGSVPNEALQAVRQAGYTDAQIVDTTLTIIHRRSCSNLPNRARRFIRRPSWPAIRAICRPTPTAAALYRGGRVMEVGCWVHCRRKFFEIAKVQKTPGLASVALAWIARLYAIERTIRDPSAGPEVTTAPGAQRAAAGRVPPLA
jgi:hypothetical protein